MCLQGHLDQMEFSDGLQSHQTNQAELFHLLAYRPETVFIISDNSLLRPATILYFYNLFTNNLNSLNICLAQTVKNVVRIDLQ